MCMGPALAVALVRVVVKQSLMRGHGPGWPSGARELRGRGMRDA